MTVLDLIDHGNILTNRKYQRQSTQTHTHTSFGTSEDGHLPHHEPGKYSRFACMSFTRHSNIWMVKHNKLEQCNYLEKQLHIQVLRQTEPEDLRQARVFQYVLTLQEYTQPDPNPIQTVLSHTSQLSSSPKIWSFLWRMQVILICYYQIYGRVTSYCAPIEAVW